MNLEAETAAVDGPLIETVDEEFGEFLEFYR